jgi:hypothetical protein
VKEMKEEGRRDLTQHPTKRERWSMGLPIFVKQTISEPRDFSQEVEPEMEEKVKHQQP